MVSKFIKTISFVSFLFCVKIKITKIIGGKFMKTKKLLSMIIAVAMIVTPLSGCGPEDYGTDLYDGEYVMDPVLNPLGSETICKEPVELEIMISANGNVQDYDTNKYTKEIERIGNVNFKFNLLPSGDSTSKINLTLSSGKDLPDILIHGLTDANVSTYGDTGVLIPLNKYYENSSEYLVPQAKKLVEDGGIDIIKYVTMTDGNIYTIPQYNESLVNEFSTVLWIYKPWLDKLGMEVPTTLEELETSLQAFKDNDLNGNGKNDEIPMVDCTANKGMIDILQTYIQTGEDDLTIKKDGSLEFAYTTDEYKEFLKYMHRLAEKGLYDKTSFSQDNATLKTLINGAEVRVGVFSHTSTSILSTAKERRLDYVPMKIMNNNVSVLFKKSMPSNMFFITKDCEHPEVAFRIGDYMCSEKMTMWSRFGEYGVDWVDATEEAEALYDFLGYGAEYETILLWGSPQNSHWQNKTPGFRTTGAVLCGAAGDDLSQVSKANAIELMYDQYPETESIVEKIIYTPEELEERSIIQNAVVSYVKQMRYNFIMGETDVDSGWDAYIRELKAMNVERLLEISQTAYDRMN